MITGGNCFLTELIRNLEVNIYTAVVTITRTVIGKYIMFQNLPTYIL